MRERDGERVARRLREAIMQLEITPGAILDEADIARWLRVSRTPVREAIIQLIADGLIVRQGRKARVAPLDIHDIPRLYDALLISSRLVHRLAAGNRTRRDLTRMARHMDDFETLVETGNGAQRSEANAAFHITISRTCGNPYVSSFYEQALNGTLRIARACFMDAEDLGQSGQDSELRRHLAVTAKEHADIFAAIEAGDVKAADATAIAHYRLTVSRLRTLVFDTSSSITSTFGITPDLRNSS